MDSMPVIKIELEGIREKISYAFLQHSNEFNEIVARSIEKALSPDTIEQRIDAEVCKAVDSAIASLSGDYAIKQIVKEIVASALNEKLDKIMG